MNPHMEKFMKKSNTWFALALVDGLAGNFHNIKQMQEPFDSLAMRVVKHTYNFLSAAHAEPLATIVARINYARCRNEDALRVMEYVWGCLVTDVSDGMLIAHNNVINESLELYLTGALMHRMCECPDIYPGAYEYVILEKVNLVNLKHGRWATTRSFDGYSVQPITKEAVNASYDKLPSTGRKLFGLT